MSQTLILIFVLSSMLLTIFLTSIMPFISLFIVSLILTLITLPAKDVVLTMENALFENVNIQTYLDNADSYHSFKNLEDRLQRGQQEQK